MAQSPRQSSPSKSVYDSLFISRYRVRSVSTKSRFIDQTPQNPQNMTMNQIRNDINQYRKDIILVKAKMNSLENQKRSHSRLKTWVQQRIKLINTARARILKSRQTKQQLIQQRQRQQQALKQKVIKWRDHLKKTRDLSVHTKSLQKIVVGKQMRQKKQKFRNQIYKNSFDQFIKKRQKTDLIKEFERSSQRRFRQKQDKTILDGLITHRNKVHQYVVEKNRQIKILRNLERRQQQCVINYQKSQKIVSKRLNDLKSEINSNQVFSKRSKSIHQKLLSDIIGKQKKRKSIREFSCLLT